jgi:hypothetical protein
MAKKNYRYSIEPRPAELGGGWRLRLLENGEEVGGGVFPLSPYLYLSDFPATDEANEREMAEKAAYEDALAEASAWVAARQEEEKQSPNARRQAAYADRQRNQGRKKYSWWMRPEEAEQVSELLRRLRDSNTGGSGMGRDGKNHHVPAQTTVAALDPYGIRTCTLPERFQETQSAGSHPHHGRTAARRTHR